MLSVQTPAKVNLFLNIRSRRADGYHEICSVMQAVRLWDRLDVSPLLDKDGHDDGPRDIQFSCNLPELDLRAKDNLVVKAYHLFWKRTGLPPLALRVHLWKEIPIQAGLGGGSSNAAAMLCILNHLSHAGFKADQLRVMASELGSDVPFFITGGTALATGRGEIIEPLPANIQEELPLVIVKPLSLSMDTTLAYHRFASAARTETRSPQPLLKALQACKENRDRGAAELESNLWNDFERVLIPEYPMLTQMARHMKEAGIQRPLLSGSGSAMFGFAEARPETRRALQALFPPEEYEIFWTQTYPEGPMQIRHGLTQEETPEFGQNFWDSEIRASR
jgi:4-diphosphocytidyl-2-C-methyl-D-erythritol kinase